MDEPYPQRGDIYYADLDPVIGSEQGGVRPVVIVQNDVGNRHSPTVIACSITSQTDRTRLPIHVDLPAGQFGLDRDSVLLGEQIRTIDKRRLRHVVSRLDEDTTARLDQALLISLGLSEINRG